jgi:hypothetical protein
MPGLMTHIEAFFPEIMPSTCVISLGVILINLHQSIMFLKNHNLMSFARIHLIFEPVLPHFSLPLPYVLTKKEKRLGIVPGA